jgi:hypothetical protein
MLLRLIEHFHPRDSGNIENTRDSDHLVIRKAFATG